MGSIAFDIRHAWRSILRRRAFAALTVLTIALGAGTNAAIFMVVKAVVLRPVPYSEPDRLVMIWRSPRNRPSVISGFRDEFNLDRQISTAAMVNAWRKDSALLEDIAAVRTSSDNPSSSVDLLDSNPAVRLKAAFATPNLFRVLGVSPARGHLWSTADADDSAIISDAFWRRQFGAMPDAIGKTIEVAMGTPRVRRQLTVVGVLPEGIRYSYPEETEVWLPLAWHGVGTPSPFSLQYQVVGRVRPGVAISAAEGELDSINEALEKTLLKVPADRRMRVRLETMHEHAIGRARPALQLVSLVTVLLGGVCGFVASLIVVTRVRSARRDLETQFALGCSRIRVARQFVLELAMLAALTVIVTVVALRVFETALQWSLPATFPRTDEIRVGFDTLFSLTVIAVVIVGVASSSSLIRVIKDYGVRRGGSPGSGASLRSNLIIGQVLLSTVLLLMSLALLRSLWNIEGVDVGYRRNDLVVTEMRLLGDKYRQPDAILSFSRDLQARITGQTGVRDVSVAAAGPFGGLELVRAIEDQNRGVQVLASERRVESNYFAMLQLPVVTGRTFTMDEDNVVVLSAGLARQLFPGGGAVGRRVGSGAQVIGVVGDVRSRKLDAPPVPTYYLPWGRAPWPSLSVLVDADRDVLQVRSIVAAAVTSIDRTQPVGRTIQLTELVRQSMAERRFYTVATAGFSVVALGLTVIAICGVTLVAVKERATEIAIRSALGATHAHQLWMLLVDGLRPALVGILLGSLVSLWISRLLQKFFFGINGVALREYVIVWLSLLVLTVLACTSAARWSREENPITALKTPT